MKYILKNCNVIDGQKNCGLKEGRAIVVRDGQIEEILASKEITPEMESNAKVIDLAGKFLMPGLINMHAHLFGTGKPSKTLGGGSSQKMLINFVQTKVGSKVLESMVKTNVTQALNSGVTTVRGVGDFFYSDVIVRDKINNGKMPGPRLIVSGPAITSPGGHGDGTFAVSAPTLAGLAEKVDINKKNGVDLIKICVTGGVMDATKKGEPRFALFLVVPFPPASLFSKKGGDRHPPGLRGIIGSHRPEVSPCKRRKAHKSTSCSAP